MLRKLCAKFDTFVTAVTIRPIFCTKRPDYIAKVHRRHPLKSGNFGEYGENDEFDVERAPLIVVILTKIANLAKILP